LIRGPWWGCYRFCRDGVHQRAAFKKIVDKAASVAEELAALEARLWTADDAMTLDSPPVSTLQATPGSR